MSGNYPYTNTTNNETDLQGQLLAVTPAPTEHSFRLLVDGSQELAVLLVTLDARIASWNASTERIFGYTEAEVLGEPFGILFVPEDRAAGAQENEIKIAARDGQAPHNGLYIRKDGSRFFADGMLLVLRDGQGNLHGFGKVIRDVTSQLHLLRALRDSEERFRSLVEATSQIVWVRSPDGEFTTDQPTWSAFTGQTFEDFRGWGWLEAVHPEDRPETAQAWSEALQSQTLYQVEHRLRRHDGSYRYMAVRGTPVREVDGSIREWVGMSIDITDHKLVEQDSEQASQLLRMSESRFRSLVEQSPLSIQILSPDGWTLQVNRAWENLWGLTLKQMRDYNMLRDQQLAEKGILPFIQRGFDGEVSAIPPIFYNPEETIPDMSAHADAGRWVRAVIHPVKDEDGRVQEVVLIHEDITQQKRAEEAREQALRAVQESEARKAAILETALDCIITIDAEDRIIEFNPAAEATFGYLRGEAVGAKMSQLIIPPLQRAAHDAGLAHYLATGEGPLLGKRIEVTAMRRDGAEFPAELAITATTGGEGSPPVFTAYLRDITTQKQTTADLQAAYERERRIAASFQQSLLRAPRKDAFPGLIVQTVYAPAWDEAQVGGDFFDAFALAAGKTAFVVGDVAGKGLLAAARTAEIKAVLRAFLREHPDPGSALERLNAYLLDGEQLDRTTDEQSSGAPASLVGLSLVVIETASEVGGNVTVAVAGMEAPLIIRSATGQGEEIPTGGPPLGAIPRISYPSIGVGTGPLEAGDLLVMATDGITEARRGRADFLGYEGLMRLAEEASRSQVSLAGIGHAILDGAIAHAGGALQDDACLLLVQRAVNPHPGDLDDFLSTATLPFDS